MNVYQIWQEMGWNWSTLTGVLFFFVAALVAGPFVRILLAAGMAITCVLLSGIARVRLNSISPSGDYVGDYHFDNPFVIATYVLIVAYVVLPSLLPRRIKENIPFNL